MYNERVAVARDRYRPWNNKFRQEDRSAYLDEPRIVKSRQLDKHAGQVVLNSGMHRQLPMLKLAMRDLVWSIHYVFKGVGKQRAEIVRSNLAHNVGCSDDLHQSMNGVRLNLMSTRTDIVRVCFGYPFFVYFGSFDRVCFQGRAGQGSSGRQGREP